MDTSFLAEIHPKVVHFPVALLTTYALLEMLGTIFNKEFISKSALLILCFGVVTAFFAVLTGNQAFAEIKFWTDESRTLLDKHQMFATYLLWFAVIVCGLRIFVVLKKKFIGLVKFLFIFFAIVILFLVYETGTHGGNLVKIYGIGTDIYNSSETE